MTPSYPKKEKEIVGVSCPICRLWRPLEKTGARARQVEKFTHEKGRIALNHGDLGMFIDIRAAKGRSGGFPRVKALGLEEAKGMPEFKDLTEQLKARCEEILKILE